MAAKKQVRSSFRAAVFRRDRYRYAFCGKPGEDRQGGDGHKTFHPSLADQKLVLLDAHHITDRDDMPNGGYVPENGVTLCEDGCHRFAEVYHLTGKPHPGYAPAELYARIDSSYEEAVRASVAQT